MEQFQSTLKDSVELSGYGVHSGLPTRVIVRPAKVNHGIVFIHRDPQGGVHRIEAHSKNAGPAELCTTITDGIITIETIEHLMAAIAAVGLDNLDIEITANEVPILDGSAWCFVEAFSQTGIIQQDTRRRYIHVTDAVEVSTKTGRAAFYPAKTMRFDITIEFATPRIGVENLTFDLTREQFISDIARARTFGFLKDVEYLWARGIALGSSLENSIVIDQNDNVINSDGLIFPDEFVRHKALDAIGDTALLGLPFIGEFKTYRSGHSLNALAVKALLDKPEAFEVIEN